MRAARAACRGRLTAFQPNANGSPPMLAHTNTRRVGVAPVEGLGEVRAGDDLADLLAPCLLPLQPADPAFEVLVVAQKIVSKAEDRFVDLNLVQPSERAIELAQLTRKDPRLVEVVLSESSDIVRAVPGVLIVRHRCGYVMANAGVDRSNVPSGPGEDRVLLLPKDADGSAAALRERLRQAHGLDYAVIVSDSFGRPWRHGVVNVALGAAGLPSLVDWRGERDREGRPMEMTQVASADLIASAAGLVMGEASQGAPAAVVSGLAFDAPPSCGLALVRPAAEDLFR